MAELLEEGKQMLQIEVDIFSGRPNPTWIITGEGEASELLAAAAESPAALAKPGAGHTGLGFREVRVSLLGDDERARRVPREFAVGSTAAEDLKASGALARRLLEAMPRRSEIQLVQHELTPINKRIRDFSLEQLEKFLKRPPKPTAPPPPERPNPLRTTVADARCRQCNYEVSQFNPGFWNRSNVQPHNNCYNYARNWRTDTYAQPGRAHGAVWREKSCRDVTRAALADGLRKRCDCLPESEYPRRLVALVVGPGYDYHWYREQRGGFWGHKPGGGTARNYDQNNKLIKNPETCARGFYTDFCGYFYAGRSVVIN